MSLGTLSFEIEADDSGAEDALDEIAEQLEGIEEQLGEMADSAEEAGEAMGEVGKKAGLAFNLSAVKQFAKAIKALGGFIYDSAKQAADAGDGPMKDFVANVDLLHESFMRVGAQAASQLAPLLQQLADAFTHSKDAASGLKEAGNFLANVFRVVAQVGAVVIAVFDAVGTSIAGVASMIVDVLSGNMQGAADTWEQLGKELGSTFDRLAERSAAIWQQGNDFAGKIGKRDKKAEQAQAARDTASAQFQYSTKAIEAEIESRKALHAAIGDSEAQFRIASAGTADFDHAMAQYEKAAMEAATMTKESALAQADGQTYVANLMKMEADSWAASAQKYAAAADAWTAKMAANVDTVSGAIAALGGAILQAVPRLNQLVQAAQQGASAGGVWGALIAVLVQLISETQGFQQIIDHVNKSLDGVLAVLEPLVSGLAAVFDATGSVTEAFTSTLGGPLETIGALLESLTPILEAFDDVLKVVSDGLDGVMGFMKTAGQPIFKILELIGTLLKVIAPLLQILMLPLEIVGMLFTELGKALEPAFKEIDKAISWLANRLDEFGDYVATIGERLSNFFKGKGFKSDAEIAATAASTPESRGVTDRGGQSGGLIDPTWVENSDAVDDNTTAQVEMTKATIAATEALTNVPVGIKVAAHRFEQSQALGELVTAMASGQLLSTLLGIPQMAAGGIVTRPTLAMIGEAGPEAVVPLGRGSGGDTFMIENLTVVTPDPDDFLRKLRRKAYMKTGAAFGS